MTATLAPPGSVTDERAVRIPPIAVNLLPVEIVDDRRNRKVRKTVLIALALFLAGLAGWYALAAGQTLVARGALDHLDTDVQRLQRQQDEFHAVVSAQAESRTINEQLAALLTRDLRWAQVLADVRGAAPHGIQLVSVNASLEAADSRGGTADKRLPNTSGSKTIGTVAVTGTGTSKSNVAAYVDALAKLTGVANPLLLGAAQQGTAWQFTVRLDITEAALGGRYTKSRTAPK